MKEALTFHTTFLNPNSRTLDPCSRHGVVYTIVNCLSTYLPCASRTSSLCTFCCQLRVAQTQILTRYAISLRAPTHLTVRKTRDRVKKPAKKVVKKAAAKKAPAKPRKTAAERRAEEMRWYRHHTSYDAFYQEAYDDDAEEARDRLEGKGYRIYDIDDCIDLKEIAAYAKSSALSEWLRCKSAEEMQAAIDSTNVPMPAAIKKQAKERIKVLQEEASRGIERPRAVMRSDVREQRRTELEESLHRRHPDLHIRDDSKMCDSYLNLRWVVSFRIPLFFVRPIEDSVTVLTRALAHSRFVRSPGRETTRNSQRSQTSCTRCGFCSTTRITARCRAVVAMQRRSSATSTGTR